MPKKSTKAADDSDGSEKIEVKGVPKINDVSKPGETPPSATSRPIITNRSGMIKQDPMVAGKPADDKNKDDQPVEEDSEQIIPKTELKIEPVEISEGFKQDDENKSEKPADKEEEKTEAEDEKPAAQEKPEETETADDSSSESAAIDSLATTAEQKTAAKESEAEQKRAEKTQELIASKKYYVPIVEGGHKASSQRFVTWLLLFLLLVAIGVYLAIDAGFIDVGISLPFDLIKN